MQPPGRPPESGRRTRIDRRRERPAPGERRSTLAVYRLLVWMARSDATVTAEERAMLGRYRQALEVRAEIDPPTADPSTALVDLPSIPQLERVHVLHMLFRVAYADGTCSETELNLLKRIAGLMGLSAVQFADVHVSMERKVLRRRRTVRFVVAAAAVVVITVVSLLFVVPRRVEPAANAETEARLDDATREIYRLKERIDQVGVERAEQDAARIRETSDKLDHLQGELLARVGELERAHDAASPDRSTAQLAAELAALRRQLARLQDRQADFKKLEKSYAGSVVLILVNFDVVSGSDRKRSMGFGSGFFVTPGGLIVTNKHVVQPWKFVGDSVKLLEGGYRLDPDSVRMAAWISGSDVLSPAGKTILDTAFDSAKGTLKIAALPADEIERRPELLSDGTVYVGRFHAQNDADLALLQASVKQPVAPLPLGLDPGSVEKLDPVMVLGFPSGPAILENGRAETSPSLGDVRKVEETVFVTAPIVPGNSGGPVIDRTGRVIAIATRTAAGEATLGSCIQSRRVLPLLPEPSELVAEAASLIEDGHREHGRALLELADARGPGAADRSRIRQLRAGLERSR